METIVYVMECNVVMSRKHTCENTIFSVSNCEILISSLEICCKENPIGAFVIKLPESCHIRAGQYLNTLYLNTVFKYCI